MSTNAYTFWLSKPLVDDKKNPDSNPVYLHTIQGKTFLQIGTNITNTNNAYLMSRLLKQYEIPFAELKNQVQLTIHPHIVHCHQPRMGFTEEDREWIEETPGNTGYKVGPDVYLFVLVHESRVQVFIQKKSQALELTQQLDKEQQNNLVDILKDLMVSGNAKHWRKRILPPYLCHHPNVNEKIKAVQWPCGEVGKTKYSCNWSQKPKVCFYCGDEFYKWNCFC